MNACVDADGPDHIWRVATSLQVTLRGGTGTINGMLGARMPLVSCAAAAAVLLTASGRAAPDGRALFVQTWTVSQGLGPDFNATSCVSCHPEAIESDASADIQAFVWFAPGLNDPTGGALFRRFTVSSHGAVTARLPPRGATRRRPPRLAGIGAFEALKGPVPAAGRFGWKARYPSLTDAVAAALAAEMGLTTARFPQAEDRRRTPEVTDRELSALVAFVRALPPPPPPVPHRRGAQVFERLGCVQCHARTRASQDAAAPQPLTDLQLHDLGPALADGIQEGAASGRQFRTAPLWGLRYVRHGYLHDGRADTLEDAILAHEGGAAVSRARYQMLSRRERAAVLEFLQGL